MTEVTVEEAKSVIEEVTRYECDKCSYRGTEDEVVRYNLGHPNPERGHLCEDCAEAGRYADLVETTDLKTRIGDRIDWSIDVASLLVPFGFGLAIATGGTFFLWQGILIPSLNEDGLRGAVTVGFVMSMLCAAGYGMVVAAMTDDSR